MFCPEIKVALGEVRHNVHDFLDGEVADILLAQEACQALGDFPEK